MTIILAATRAFIQEAGTAFDPELALLEVVAHTHYLPRHWRGRAHSREVQGQFESLFQFKVSLRSSQCCPSPLLKVVGSYPEGHCSML